MALCTACLGPDLFKTLSRLLPLQLNGLDAPDDAPETASDCPRRLPVMWTPGRTFPLVCISPLHLPFFPEGPARACMGTGKARSSRDGRRGSC